MVDWQRSLKGLVETIPPPVEPRCTSGPLLQPALPALPEDHAALVNAYGSGEFSYGEIGCVIEVFNPRDPRHDRLFREGHEILQEYRDSEGEESMPYPIDPAYPLGSHAWGAGAESECSGGRA